MSNYINTRDIRFNLFEVFNAPQLGQYERFQDYDAEAMQMAVDAAKQIGDQYLFPIYREMDKNKAYYKDGEVHVHPKLREAIKAIGDGGWINAEVDYDDGGQQMPLIIKNAGLFTFYAANANAACYAFLTSGAANLIYTFASSELKEEFLPNMYSGDWQGTMALTEPQAGSSLTDLTASAKETAEGHYLINGQKIYISSGDHTATDNVVHLLLAKIEGAPAGTKGISLFVVPKFRGNGQKISNGVTTAGIYGKMGQKGYVAAHLMLGEQEECHGYLVGKPHHGLKYMFQMMNEARIGTGLVAAGNATAAYHASLKYANERPQGRHPSNKDPHTPQVLIIEHADVRRMLLEQKAISEGSFSLLIQCSLYADLVHVLEGEEKEKYHLLLGLLTPIAKSFPSEFGTRSVSSGLQVLGGAGYTDDFPLEQYYRDIRINAIYEGTTAIHGMDLLGRKVMMNKGAAVKYYMDEIKSAMADAQHDSVKHCAAELGVQAKLLHRTTLALAKLATEDRPEVFLADATLYLECFGLVTVAWQWLKMGTAAAKALDGEVSYEDRKFYQSKLHAMDFFFEYELPKTLALHKRLMSTRRVTLEAKPEEIV